MREKMESQLDLNEIKSLLFYENGNLYWKVKVTRQINAGDLAGHTDVRGYRVIRINKKLYKAHRIIFFMHHGFLPKYVDHINGNKSDNRIENLREATHSQNAHNSKIRKDSKVGVKNVRWDRSNNKWRVDVQINKKRIFFGRYEDLELAELVAIEARNKYHGDFAHD